MRIMGRYLVVRCPKCGYIFIYSPRSKNYKNWRARCPRCNHKFKVYPEKDFSRILYVADNPFVAKRWIDIRRGYNKDVIKNKTLQV